MTLVERDAPLEQLAAALEDARQGRGSTVLVSGEAGIGKTSLLQEFAEDAWPTARVLVGACEDLLTPRPLGPFRDMARDAGGLAGLAGEDRDAFLDALLAEMSFRQRPAVVIVEDAHWADAASLDIIRYLARRIDRLAALLVVSYRDEELGDDHPFARMVAALAGPSVLRIELEGLSDEAVAATHVSMALETVTLLQEEMGPDDAIMHYVRYFNLPSVEAQIIFRRTLAAWAERHAVRDLPPPVCAATPRPFAGRVPLSLRVAG